MSEALVFAAASIEANEFEGTRRVIDLSGDGPNTMGGPVDEVRDVIVRQRIIINALAIDLPEYKHDFPGGAGRYVQTGRGYDHMIVNGQPFMENGHHAGALAGQTLRP